MSLFTKLFGTKSERELKKNQPLVKAILAKDEEYSALSNEELRGKTDELRARLANGATIDDNDIIIEAFAAAREATWRALEKKPFEVQVVGGLVLHQGRIAEMKTGEGKTITAVMPAYLNALTGNPVHIVTVNDYLAKFQGEMMSKVFRMLGMTTGIILRDLRPAQRREAYACDITYATNNELGFDYLRDNMAIYQSELVQRGRGLSQKGRGGRDVWGQRLKMTSVKFCLFPFHLFCSPQGVVEGRRVNSPIYRVCPQPAAAA